MSDTFDPQEHMQQVPHARALGIELRFHTGDECEVEIANAAHLVGDPDSGVIHGGVMTAVLDNAAGFVARPADMPREKAAIATLDLRIDYMGSADPTRNIIARAHCFKRTKNVAFVRAVAYQTVPEEPIATGTATFMLGTRNHAGRA